MVSKTFELYKKAYTGLSPQTWLLSLIMLINRSGTMVVPFLTLYLTRPQMGYSIDQAGIVMGLFGLGAVIGAHLSGKLTDKIGFYPIQLFTLAFGGFLFFMLSWMNSYASICVTTFLLSFVNEAFRPANATAVAYYSKTENRTRSYALNRLAINLGWAVGNAIGGFVASINYKWLFWIDGTTNILAAIAMFFLLKPENNGKREHKEETINPADSVYKDKEYRWFILLVVLFAACFFQLFTNLPAYFRNDMHYSERFIGLLGTVNGLIIAFIEMVLIFQIEGKRRNTYFITRGVLICGLAYLLLAVFPTSYSLAMIMIVSMTFGEILSMPFMNSFWIERSKNHNRGQYAAMYTMAWATAQTLGPVIGALIAAHAGFISLFWTLGICLLVASIGFYFLNAKMSRTQNLPS
ncbi:MAG: MFS transporter [Chitinophagaceae bacterium]|nr:MFS transporter [Chitinophagaceae bacterium]